jgi:Methyltransferase domain
VIEQEREQLPRPWSTRQLEELARLSRPLRRRLAPNRFKETYVNRALARYERPTTYVEIGVREGESFRLARADSKIGIDPERTPRMGTLLEGQQFFELTSDEFFEQRARGVLEPAGVHVALVDGLHEFRQVLADVLNLEPYMRPDGVVILDDCNPRTAERASETPIGGAWNGDVWKLPAYLLEQRPDLRVATIDADEGVGVIAGFGKQPPAPDPAAVERFKSLPYEHLARDRTAVLNLVPPSAFGSLLPQTLRASHSSNGLTTPRH